MKTTFVLCCAAALVLVATAAYAAQLLSPVLWTGIDTSAGCYIRNTGTSAVPVSVSLFSNQPGFGPDFDNCNGGPLGAGKTCVLLSFDLPDDSYVGCSVNGDKVSRIRGTLELRQTTPILKVIASEELR
jgi:hypothetical protein